MPIPLPLNSLTVPVQMRRMRLGVRTLERFQALILLIPPDLPRSAWTDLPHGRQLQALHERKTRRAGDAFAATVGDAGTLVVIGCAGADSSMFERLQLAQKCTKLALESAPRNVLVAQRLPAPAAGNAISALLSALQAGAFELPTFKSKPRRDPRLRQISLADRLPADALASTLATAAGNNLARWLTALPPNELDARSYRRYLQRIAAQSGFRMRFFSEAQLKRLGAGAFLAVSQGNATRDAGIVHLSHRPGGARAPKLCLVGKGICFDTGGTNLKPHRSMLDMHIDMEGSAVALGTMLALVRTDPKIAVDCWMAITENRIGPTASKPQDVVRALNGTTIQMIHTDAEGRMVLADTLALAARSNPGAIIDYATLTGACIHALTERYSGAFTNRMASRLSIEAAGAQSGERVWCFPMDEDFDADIESQVADIKQCAVEGKGDHILAARFLNRFVPPNIPWLHLDLSAGHRQGGLGGIGTDITGFGVRLSLQLIGNGWPRTRDATS